jgi:signal transduction histidine kinase/ActR/RegA family two-component response regulator
MSLRARLMVLVLLATVLPALLLGWRFLRDSDAEVDAAVAALTAAAEAIAEDLDHRVQGTAQLHYGLAHSRVLETADRETCSAYLSEVRQAYPQYTGLLTVRPDGMLQCDSLQTGRTLNLLDRSYFQRVSQPGTGLVLEPAFGRLTGLAVLQIVYPARSPDGRLRFVLVASLNLSQFVQGSRKGAAQGEAELLLVDHKGMLLVRAGPGASALRPGVPMAGTALFGLAQARAGGGVGEVADASGRPEVWAVAASPAARQAGLFVMLGRPRHELVADARLRLRHGLITLGVAALLLFAGVWWLADRGIRRPVGRISSMARALGQGDLGARIAPPYPRGELGGLMAVLNSTAASLQRQREDIEALGLKLRQAQKLEAVGTLAGGIAHDFNNILGSILGNLSLAREEALAGRPDPEGLAQIHRAAMRARDLVQRIQAFSRAEASALAPQLLQPIVEEVLALVQVALPAGANLRAELDAAPLRVLADATQLHQVLLNLCTNAWQALEGQAGTVTVGLHAVTLDAQAVQPLSGLRPGRHAHLWVRDTGCGMSEAQRARIFEPFYTTKGARGGTGLGLSVVYGIVSAHAGSIALDSQPGAGSTFHLYLPLIAEPAPAGAAEPPPSQAADTLAGQGQRIIYLDDDEVMGLMVERLLTRAGWRPSIHTSAQSALAAVRADPRGCDLLVTDFNMPELSGLEVCRQLAALRPGLPVLLISGYIFDELPEQARRAGVRALVRKQHVLEELVPAIAVALAQAEAEAETGGPGGPNGPADPGELKHLAGEVGQP